jgi:hypothetical protein
LQLAQLTKYGLNLVVHARGFTGGRLLQQHVDVNINGRDLGRWTFAQDEGIVERHVAIPPDLVAPQLRITFVIINPTSPVEMGLSGDDRKLGLFLQSLRVQENDLQSQPCP